MISSALTVVGIAALAILILAILVAVTWLTFPTATVLRSLGPGGHTRWVRQALGSAASIRDLGDIHEAEATLSGHTIRISWSDRQTRVELRGGSPPGPQALAHMERHGQVVAGDTLIWTADRPPDPQLKRVVSLMTSERPERTDG